MRVGVNYAWHNYAWDFGLPPRKDSGNSWGKRAAFADSIVDELRALRRLGLFAVRWFLLGDGTTYGVDTAQPHLSGQDGTTWRFDDSPPIGSEFLADFEFLLRACGEADMQLLPSLVDFHMCSPGQRVPGSSGIVKSGRADVVADVNRRQQFFQRVLAPLLELSAAYRRTIYAFELINEPEWCTRQAPLIPALSDDKRTVAQEDMRAFIHQGAQVINHAGFLSTVGFAKYETLAQWRCLELGLTLHQFHYYADVDVIPAQSFDPQWPLIVGEIATAVHRPWQELGPRQDVLSRLRLLSQKGYPVTFLWSCNRAEESAPEPAVDWSERTRSLVSQFTLAGSGAQ